MEVLLFELGRVVATPGALADLAEADEPGDMEGLAGMQLLARHSSGDWGEMPPEDVAENALSLREGYRLMSSYTLPTDKKLWIITEADRSVTTILRPEDY